MEIDYYRYITIQGEKLVAVSEGEDPMRAFGRSPQISRSPMKPTFTKDMDFDRHNFTEGEKEKIEHDVQSQGYSFVRCEPFKFDDGES